MKIDSCWIINNSSAAGFPFRQKCPENIPAMRRNTFNEAEMETTEAAGVEATFLRFFRRCWDENRNGTPQFTRAKLHFTSISGGFLDLSIFILKEQPPSSLLQDQRSFKVVPGAPGAPEDAMKLLLDLLMMPL